MRDYRLSDQAKEDILSITAYTLDNLGDAAWERYFHLIEGAFLKLQEDPANHGVRTLGSGIFRYHLNHCREDAQTPWGMVKKPRHQIFFKILDDDVIEVVRILHDGMDFERHLQDLPED